MTFRPLNPMQGPRSAIELWDGIHMAATIYATAAGIHIRCEPGWEPASIEQQLHDARSLVISFSDTRAPAEDQ